MRGTHQLCHRPACSHGAHADQILVLDKARSSRVGVHEELLEKSELYASIYSSQLYEIRSCRPMFRLVRPNLARRWPHEPPDVSDRIAARSESGQVARRLAPYLKPYRGKLLLIGAILIVSVLADLAGPYLIGVAVDQFINRAARQGHSG
jgi:ABC-type bacteriocin/lantibiotic exporter with double-glycine peptidase domain